MMGPTGLSGRTLTVPCVTQDLCKLLELNKVECERRGFHGKARKPVVKVERFGSGRYGVDNHEPRRNLMGSAQRPPDDIGEKRPRQSFPLPRAVNRKTAEQDGRNGLRHVPPHCACCLVGKYLPHAQRIIASNTRRSQWADNIGSTGGKLQIVKGAMTQPVIKHLLPRIKGRCVMCFCQEDRSVKEWARASQFSTEISIARDLSCQRLLSVSRRHPSNP